MKLKWYNKFGINGASMKIYVKLTTFFRHVQIKADLDKNVVLVKKKKTEIDAKDFATRLLYIIEDWKEKNTGDLIDSDEYEIKIQDGDTITNYYGKGSYPLNYGDFKRLIGEISGARI